MSKQIKLTNAKTGEKFMVTPFMTEKREGKTFVFIRTNEGCWVEESLDEIEALMLRDEFAKASMQAIQGAITFTESNNRYDQAAYNGCIAKHAYEMADAMLKERSK